MTTPWLHCFETASPSVRDRISTAPPAGYGTKICTGLDGNGACADAIPPALNIAVTAARIRNQLPIASLPIFLLLVLSHAGFSLASPQGADQGYDQAMLTIPLIASSFGA